MLQLEYLQSWNEKNDELSSMVNETEQSCWDVGTLDMVVHGSVKSS